MSTKIYQVSWANSLNYNDYCRLFVSKEKARIFAEQRKNNRGAIDVKLSEVTDIWNYTARNFSEKIEAIIEELTTENGGVLVKGESPIWTIIEREAKAAGFNSSNFSCDCNLAFETADLKVYSLSCAWYYNNVLNHFTTHLEVF